MYKKILTLAIVTAFVFSAFAAGVQKSGWTVTTVASEARTALEVSSTSEMDDAIATAIAGFSGSQTPLTGDVDAAGYSASGYNSITSTNVITSSITGQSTAGGPRVILRGALGTDDTWSGTSITNFNGGETISQWSLVRVHSDGEFHLADADAAGEFPAIGIASISSTDGNPINVIVQGVVRNDAWNWTVGGSLYLSATAGDITQTAPTTSGHAVQRVGVALSADSAYFNFSGEWGVNE